MLDEGDAEWLGEGLVVIGGALERRWGGRCSVGFAGKKLGSLCDVEMMLRVVDRAEVDDGVRFRRRGALGRETAVAAGFLGSRRGWDGTEGVDAVRCAREGVESVA